MKLTQILASGNIVMETLLAPMLDPTLLDTSVFGGLAVRDSNAPIQGDIYILLKTDNLVCLTPSMGLQMCWTDPCEHCRWRFFVNAKQTIGSKSRQPVCKGSYKLDTPAPNLVYVFRVDEIDRENYDVITGGEGKVSEEYREELLEMHFGSDVFIKYIIDTFAGV